MGYGHPHGYHPHRVWVYLAVRGTGLLTGLWLGGGAVTHTISTNGAPPTHLIQGAQAGDVGSACQGHLLHVHGLILPHGLLHSDLHGPELLWGQWGLGGCRGNRPTGSQPRAWE